MVNNGLMYAVLEFTDARVRVRVYVCFLERLFPLMVPYCIRLLCDIRLSLVHSSDCFRFSGYSGYCSGMVPILGRFR